ncbi:gamma-glutamylcyclotransferase [Paradesertivirga mongoliensis]|uniref:Gamma-glutamylcyclotransferase n=1 Tax=Paradesertivirga mongoliensis TaxID=2100740 RepID=A0ABW4ZNU4_9SPHI|nr:gamma-glutamylcyclotransferase family protein [Pedobacter mongoliensis]
MDYLFIYGTLLMQENPWGMYLSQQSEMVCQAKLSGFLYDAGEYPGAIYVPESDSYIYGSVMTLQNPDEALRIMDQYEGFGSEESQPNEFIRRKLAVKSDIGPLTCWVYLYNWSTQGLSRINSGDYLKFRFENT